MYVPTGWTVAISDALFTVMLEGIPWPQRQQELGSESISVTNATIVPVPTPAREILSSPIPTLGNILHSYICDEEHYSGSPSDNFDRKLTLFNYRCEQAGVSDGCKPKAISIMLCGNALQSYFDLLEGKGHEYKNLLDGVKERFVIDEHAPTLLQGWISLTLQTSHRRIVSSCS